MGDPFRKVQPGQELAIPAEAYNGFVDAAVAVRRNRRLFEQGGERDFREATIVKVRNQSGNDRSRFAVLGIDGPIISPADHLLNFQNQVAVNGVVPDIDEHLGHFVILLEPLKANAIGRAVIAGVTVARVNVVSSLHPYADIADGSHDLASGWYGAADILWLQSTSPGTTNGLVRIGNWNSCKLAATVTQSIGINPGSSGSVSTLTDPAETLTAHLPYLHSNQFVANGKRVFIEFFRHERRWVITGAEC